MKDKGSQMKIVNKLIEKGKKKGSLTYKEVMDELYEIDLTPEQIEKVYEVLESMEIDVIGDMHEAPTPATGAQAQTEPETEELDVSIPEGISIDDPVRMYLKEIGKVSLLS
jgi:RNA polymerase primary sigma factor